MDLYNLLIVIQILFLIFAVGLMIKGEIRMKRSLKKSKNFFDEIEASYKKERKVICPKCNRCFIIGEFTASNEFYYNKQIRIACCSACSTVFKDEEFDKIEIRGINEKIESVIK